MAHAPPCIGTASGICRIVGRSLGSGIARHSLGRNRLSRRRIPFLWTSAMTSRPILVVEDDASLRQVLVDHLKETGNMEPVEAATLAEATERLASPDARFDAILLD